MCYTEKAPNTWHRRGTQKTGNTYNSPNRPNRHTSQAKHQALPKGQPGRRITPINTAAVHASAQQQPTMITLTRQGHQQILSANAARWEAQEQYRRVVSHGESNIGQASPRTTIHCTWSRSSGVVKGLHGYGWKIVCFKFTLHVTTATSSADLMKPNQTPARHTLAIDTIVLQIATPQAASSQRMYVARTQGFARMHPVTRRVTT